MLRAETGATEDVAIKTASEMVRVFQERFGGDRLYVPRPPRYDEAAVLRDFSSGQKAQDIIQRHGIPERNFYRLLRRRNRPPTTPAAPKVSMDKPRQTPPRKTEFSW